MERLIPKSPMFDSTPPSGFTLWGIFGYVTLIGWILLIPVALVLLKRSKLPGLEIAVWVLVVLFVPTLGVLAFLIVRPDRLLERRSGRRSGMQSAKALRVIFLIIFGFVIIVYGRAFTRLVMQLAGDFALLLITVLLVIAAIRNMGGALRCRLQSMAKRLR